MRKHNSVRELTMAAMIAALYTALGYFGSLFSLTFGVVQVRFAEALTVLPYFFPAAAPGLAVGCFLTNLLSPYGPLDLILGTLATALAAFLTTKMPHRYLAPLPPILCNALILPPMWAWTEIGACNSAFWSAWGFNLLTFLPGQIIACYGLGLLLLKLLPRLTPLRPYLSHKIS